MLAETVLQGATLSREVRLAGTVVFVDGITRAGKSLMGPILASYARVEIERVEEIIEYIGILHWMGKLSTDAAISMLRLETDFQLQNSLLGRNTNFRFGDHSSVWKNPSRWRYFKRLFSDRSGTAPETVAKERPIYQNMTHEQLANFGLLHQAFEDDLRVVEMVRNPMGLVDSWLRRGWGTRFGTDPLALTFCVRHGEQDVPYYALGWEGIYVDTNPEGRVIRTVASLWDRSMDGFKSLSDEHKRQVLFIPYEGFIQDPDPYVAPLGDFIGSAATKHTRSALRRQNCPRKFKPDLAGQVISIRQKVSAEEFSILNRLVEEYETVVANLPNG